jgi:hypothetical protein
MSTPRAKPLEKFITATSRCTLEVCHSLPHHDLPILISSQGASYGKCIVAEYQNVRKDMCAKEFMQLKNCYLVIYRCILERSDDANELLTGGSRQETMIA